MQTKTILSILILIFWLGGCASINHQHSAWTTSDGNTYQVVGHPTVATSEKGVIILRLAEEDFISTCQVNGRGKCNSRRKFNISPIKNISGPQILIAR